MQLHVNECLRRQEERSEKEKAKTEAAAGLRRDVENVTNSRGKAPGTSDAAPVRIAKLAYDMMSLKQVADACRRYGIPVEKGINKEDLVWRYSQLEILSKSDADSGGGKNLQALVKEVLKAEKLKKKRIHSSETPAVCIVAGKRKEHPNFNGADGIGTAAKRGAANLASGSGTHSGACDRLSRDEWKEMIRKARETLRPPEEKMEEVEADEDIGIVPESAHQSADGSDENAIDINAVAERETMYTSDKEKARASDAQMSEHELQDIISNGLLDECCVVENLGYFPSDYTAATKTNAPRS